jgi:hypothetical protein
MTVISQAAAAPAPAEAPQVSAAPNSNSSAASSLPTPLSGAPAAPQAENQPVPAARPEGLPAGFNDMQAFVQAYEALQAKADAPQAGPVSDPMQVVDAALVAAKVDLEALNAEYMKNGSLSQATYDTLAKAGVSKSFADAAIAGREASIKAELTDIYSVVGGEGEFKKLQTWAGANLSQAEKVALNQAIDTAPADVVKLALMGVQTRFNAANGQEPTLLNGAGAGSGAVAFQNTAQVTAAMSDPRYRTDPAYRSEIEARLAVSTVL